MKVKLPSGVNVQDFCGFYTGRWCNRDHVVMTMLEGAEMHAHFD